jgi:hypothetical protein
MLIVHLQWSNFGTADPSAVASQVKSLRIRPSGKQAIIFGFLEALTATHPLCRAFTALLTRLLLAQACTIPVTGPVQFHAFSKWKLAADIVSLFNPLKSLYYVGHLKNTVKLCPFVCIDITHATWLRLLVHAYRPRLSPSSNCYNSFTLVRRWPSYMKWH